ncbi:MAG: hypothetical protein RIR17_1498 [Planctomycetota bacterium]|jgi:hypothetical protein
MIRIFPKALATMLASAVFAFSVAAQEKTGGITIDGKKSPIPAEWKEEAPTNRMRYAQFVLPKVAGDTRDAEIVIFKGLGGSAQANIDRWKDQFKGPDGGKIGNNAKVTEIKVAGKPALYLDMKGSYLFKSAPFDPNAKAELLENYRMLATHVDAESIYHIRLTGPDKTVQKYREGFEKWLANFK